MLRAHNLDGTLSDAMEENWLFKYTPSHHRSITWSYFLTGNYTKQVVKAEDQVLKGPDKQFLDNGLQRLLDNDKLDILDFPKLAELDGVRTKLSVNSDSTFIHCNCFFNVA